MMNSNSEVAVTLSSDLFETLKKESKRLCLPLEWIIASLVADTFSGQSPEPAAG